MSTTEARPVTPSSRRTRAVISISADQRRAGRARATAGPRVRGAIAGEPAAPGVDVAVGQVRRVVGHQLPRRGGAGLRAPAGCAERAGTAAGAAGREVERVVERPACLRRAGGRPRSERVALLPVAGGRDGAAEAV